jgi:hypothetical protein
MNCLLEVDNNGNKLTCQNMTISSNPKIIISFEANEYFRNYHWMKSLISDFHNILSICDKKLIHKIKTGSIQCCYQDYTDGYLYFKPILKNCEITKQCIKDLTKSIHNGLKNINTNTNEHQYTIYFIYFENEKDTTEGIIEDIQTIDYDNEKNEIDSIKNILLKLYTAYQNFAKNIKKSLLDNSQEYNKYFKIYNKYLTCSTISDALSLYKSINKCIYPDGFVEYY